LLILDLGRNVLIGSAAIEARLETAFELTLKGLNFLFKRVIKANLELLGHHVGLHWHHLHMLWHSAHLLVESLDKSGFVHRNSMFSFKLVRVVD
jgi:hypothetical protein